MRAWFVSINFCLWNSGKCPKAWVCVCEILVLLLFPQAHFVPEAESAPIGPPCAYLSRLLHTLCPLALVTCLTCSTGLDHTPSYIPAPHLHCTEWHFLKYTHTHTYTYAAACKPLQEARVWESRQPSPVAVYLLCHVREESRWLAPLSLEHIAVAVKPSSARLKTRQAL